MCSEELGKMKIKTKGNQQTLEQDRCELNEMHSKQIRRWKHQHEWSTRSLILWGEQNLILAAGRTQSWGEGRDNREGWERTQHAAVYDSHNDHYLVQRLGAGAVAEGMTSPSGASSEDQTQCISKLLAAHSAQLNSTDVSSKHKRSREYK